MMVLQSILQINILSLQYKLCDILALCQSALRLLAHVFLCSTVFSLSFAASDLLQLLVSLSHLFRRSCPS